MKQNPRSVERVLGYVNRIRLAYGLKPLKRLKRGKRTQSTSCPIARSINGRGRVLGTHIKLPRPESYPVSKTELRRFTQLLDNLGITGHDRTNALYTFKSGLPVTIYTPKYVSEFVTRFDKGQIPELIG